MLNLELFSPEMVRVHVLCVWGLFYSVGMFAARRREHDLTNAFHTRMHLGPELAKASRAAVPSVRHRPWSVAPISFVESILNTGIAMHKNE